MVSALTSGLSSLGLSPGRGHGVVFLGEALGQLPQCLFPPRCINGTGKFNAVGNPAMD